MSTNTLVGETSKSQALPVSVKRQRRPSGNVLCLLSIALGCVPLLWWHLAGLLHKPHYQFVMLVPVGLLVLWVQHRTAEPQAPGSSAQPLPWLLACAATAGLALAAWGWSPWLGMVAALLAALPCLYWTGGSRAVWQGMPAWVFAWMLVPLPFGMDEDLIVRLRGITTRITSSVLDQLGVFHLSYANVIELPGKPLFIADACSGIHSLYVLLAVALFWALWRGRGLLHVLLLGAATFGLVLVENVARLVGVAVALQWRMDLSEGTDHLVFGMLLFVLSLLLVLSTDQLLLAVLPFKPGQRLWQRFFSFPGPASASPKSPAERQLSRVSPGLVGMACFFLAIGTLQVVRMPAAPPNLAAAWMDRIELPQFGVEILPEEIDGFQRMNFELIERVAEDPFGIQSQQWTYKQNDLVVLISLDYPFNGIHDSSVCYEQIGWTMTDKQIISSSDLPEVADPVGLAKMQRPLYGYALLLFSVFDESGKTEVVIKEQARGEATERAAKRLAWIERQAPETVPVVERGSQQFIQLHLLVRTAGEMDESTVNRLVKFYVAAREQLRSHCVEEMKNR